MPVRYVRYGRNNVRVSRRWNIVLTEADRDKVGFTLNSGYRSEAEQAALFAQNMFGPGRPRPGRPLTAVPNRNAPHTRTGRADHALDVNTLDGGESRLERWIEEQGARIEWNNTVPGEPWHGEVPADDLRRLARRIERRNARRRKAKPKPKPRPKKPPPRPRNKDAQLAAKLKAHGADFALEIIQEARRENVPLSWALALVDQETNFRNIFGGDHGALAPPTKVPYFRVPVTAERVKALLRWIDEGHASNGVGPAQLTSVGYIRRAEQLGGAHKPRINIRVGLQVLNEKTGRDYGNQAWRYNGSPVYQAQIEAKQRRWARVL